MKYISILCKYFLKITSVRHSTFLTFDVAMAEKESFTNRRFVINTTFKYKLYEDLDCFIGANVSRRRDYAKQKAFYLIRNLQEKGTESMIRMGSSLKFLAPHQSYKTLLSGFQDRSAMSIQTKGSEEDKETIFTSEQYLLLFVDKPLLKPVVVILDSPHERGFSNFDFFEAVYDTYTKLFQVDKDSESRCVDLITRVCETKKSVDDANGMFGILKSKSEVFNYRYISVNFNNNIKCITLTLQDS